MEKKKRNRGKLSLDLGLLFLIAAVALVGYNMYDADRAETASANVVAQLSHKIEETEAAYASLPQSEFMVADYELDRTRAMPLVEIDGHYYVGTISFPSIGLELPVMDEWSYDNLKIAPCRYNGTAYMDGFSIAAHNYRRHFGPIGNLDVGAEVTFTDTDGNVFRYRVAETEIINPADSEVVYYSKWPLSLFTCTLGGRTRVCVRCERVNDAGEAMLEGMLDRMDQSKAAGAP